jgi:iron complex outermembrane receptor protein
MNGNEAGQKPKSIFRSLVCLALASVAITQQAAAQQSGKGDELEEVVVTATKRSSTVETTPISITALTGQDLEERGITDISSIVQSVPGVSM